MNKQTFSTKHIEYLEKDFLDEIDGQITLNNMKTLSLGESQLLKIKSLSNFWELRGEKVISLYFLMEDLISGLHEALPTIDS